MAVKTQGSRITGTWFPSGYHGHFRSKSRNDFVNEYRQLAKPPPPQRFLRRTQEIAGRHVFSRHDNRQSFLNDALIFEEGLGRRRVKNTTYKAQQDLMTWMPAKKELDRSGPHPTTYQVTYYKPLPIKQIVANRPKSSFGEKSSTTYRTSHGKENPFRLQLLATTREPFTEINTNRIQRASSKYGHDTVASCLNWYRPQPPSTQRPASHRQQIIAPTATEVCVPKTPQQKISADVSPLPMPSSASQDVVTE
ncbi:ciliary microtubule inner protein 7-like [Tubulanus polymorphus]|uniref:ciliary microtubule inner protein 7-like n=1 Tax=Tubulanus polymorphus TaxID=672921 RepID=UPI003DA2C42A